MTTQNQQPPSQVSPQSPPSPEPERPAPTATTESVETPAQKKDRLCREIAAAYGELQELQGKTTPAEVDPVWAQHESTLKNLRPTDAAITFDIRLWNAAGEAVRVDDCVVLRFFTERSMLAESPRNFEAMIYTQMFRPLINQTNVYINSCVVNDNPVPQEPMYGRNNTSPRLPEAGPSTYLSDTK